MSTHPIPSPSGDLEDSFRWERLETIKQLCRVYLREPENVTDDGTTISLVFTPDLTAQQTTLLGNLIAYSGILRITPSEFAAIQSDIDGLTTYQGIATPTLAQTVLAVKAQNRIWKALLRS